MESAIKTKVFITHTSTDAWLASQLETRIQACGADTFLDNRDIQHGDDFEERIRDGADSSSEQLVILTPWANEIESYFDQLRQRVKETEQTHG